MPQFSLKHIIIAVVIIAAVTAVGTFALQGNQICQAIAVAICFIVPVLLAHAITYLCAYVATRMFGWPKNSDDDADAVPPGIGASESRTVS